MTIVCYGDSNTWGYDPRSFLGGRYPAEYRWPELLAQKTGCKVVNMGIIGLQIPNNTFVPPENTENTIFTRSNRSDSPTGPETGRMGIRRTFGSRISEIILSL